MIEAVNAVVSNSQVLRSIAEQTSTTQTLAANPSRIQSAAVSAPYLSPHVDYNGGNSKPIFVVRDSSTGETVKQFPSEAQIRAYHKAAAARDQALAHVQYQQGDSAEAAAQRSADVAKSSIEFKQARQAIKHQNEQSLPGQKAAKSESAGSGSGSSAALGKVVTSVDTQA